METFDFMPTIKELEHSIIEQCMYDKDILTLVHDNKFDEEKYHKLISTLKAYQQAIAPQQVMSRKIAGFLRTIEIVFDIAVHVYDREPIKSEEGRKIKDAHPEILEVMDNIFDVNLADEMLEQGS